MAFTICASHSGWASAMVWLLFVLGFFATGLKNVVVVLGLTTGLQGSVPPVLVVILPALPLDNRQIARRCLGGKLIGVDGCQWSVVTRYWVGGWWLVIHGFFKNSSTVW